MLIITFALMMLAACGSKDDTTEIILTDKEQEIKERGTAEDTEEALQVAVAAMISSKESMVYYEDLIEYLGEELDRSIELVQRRTYSEVNDLLRANKVDFAFICTYAYVLGDREFGLELIAAPQVNGKKTYQNYMIVHEDSNIDSFKELKGEDFAFTDPISFTGRLYTIHKLQQMGYEPKEYFSEIIYTYSHDNSIEAVAQKLVTGASIDGLILEYLYETDPEYYGNIKVIHKSEGFGMPPVVMPPGDDEFKEELQEIFINMHTDDENKEILERLNIDKFFIPQPEGYEAIDRIASVVISND